MATKYITSRTPKKKKRPRQRLTFRERTLMEAKRKLANKEYERKKARLRKLKKEEGEEFKKYPQDDRKYKGRTKEEKRQALIERYGTVTRKVSGTLKKRRTDEALEKFADKTGRVGQKKRLSRRIKESPQYKDVTQFAGAVASSSFRRLTAPESRRGSKRRQRAAQQLGKAFGVLPGTASMSGPGRPRGSYKYKISGRPVSVFAWRAHQAKQKQLYQQYQQQQLQRMSSKGFSKEQVQDLQQRQIVQQFSQPPQQVQPQQSQQPQPQVQPNQQQQRPMPENNADNELMFKQFQMQQTVTPNTQQILDNIRRIQNKGKLDNMEQQRRHFERGLVGRSMNMMKAHENMVKTNMDFTGVSHDNILSAPSVFKENPDDMLLRSRGRPNVLQTRESGNRLSF